MKDERQTINISSFSIIKIILVLLGFWFLYLIRDVLLILFVSLVIVTAFSLIINKWSKKMPRALAVSILYLIFLLFLAAIGFLIIPPLIKETAQLANNLPFYIEQIQPLYNSFRNSHSNWLPIIQRGLEGFSSQLSSISSGLFQTTLGIFGGLITIITILVLTFYFMLEEQGVKKFLISLMPVEHKEQIVHSLYKIGDKMGAWLRGQLILSLTIGLFSGVAMAIVGVPYALTLGVWAGFFEVIPYIGPIIGAVPAVLIALFISPVKALIVLIIYVVIQQLEAHILVPRIMQKAVGLSPVVVILALLIGGKLMGVVGAILAIPIAAILSVIANDWPQLKRGLMRD